MEEGRHVARMKKVKQENRQFWRSLATALIAVIGLSTAGAAAFIGIVPLTIDAIGTPSEVYDLSGALIGTLEQNNRIMVPEDQIPQALRDAIVSIEDERFYRHIGVDPIGIVRAVVANVTHGEVVQGASTITQQLARNLYLTFEQTFARKIKEAVLAVRLERTYDKKEILNRYLNEIYFGSGTWGVEMAAQTYFGKSTQNLTIAECAALAGIPRNPEFYSPLNNPDATKSRRNLVLSRMQQYGYISAQQAQEAQSAPLKITSRDTTRVQVASYFLNAVVGHIASRYETGLEMAYRGGLKIYTGLDLTMQKAAERAISRLPKFSTDDQGVTQPQTALIALDPQTGQIRTYIGGRDFHETQFDRAVNAKRQPGSAFKPFLYSAAIDSKRYTAASLFWCTPEGATFPQGGNLPPYKPTDFGNAYHWRQMTLREALAQSDNVIAVKLNSEVGPEVTARYATNMGITSPLTANLPLALGASDVTPLEITAAYCTLANGGYRVQPILVTKIVDTNGRVLEENHGKRERVLDEKTAYVVTSLLKSVIEPGGTATAGAIGRPVAGKTGTSDEFRDAWFIGYTPELVTGIYVGDDHKQPLQQTGGALTSPIWAAFMKEALASVPASDFKVPNGIKTVRIDPTTGYVATPYCPNPRNEIFITGTEPRQTCPTHKAPPAPQLPNWLDWIPRIFNGR